MWIIVAALAMASFTTGYAEEQSVSINRPVEGLQNQWMQFSTDYVRCYCNLPACVSTGYMCKSRGGGCFSDLLDNSPSSRSSIYRGRHGCLELLSDIDQKAWCDTREDRAKLSHKRKHPRNLFVCCRHDMCNHIENPQTKNILNSTLFGQILEDSTGDHRQINAHQENLLYSNSEVWFRAATIAVPICGAVILFVLIALAVKILKSENENSPNHKLGPALYIHRVPSSSQSKNSCEKFPDYFDNLLSKPNHQQNLLLVQQNEDHQRQIHAPLLLQNEIYHHQQQQNKNEEYAKLNRMKNENVCEYLEKNCDHFPDVNVVKEGRCEKFV